MSYKFNWIDLLNENRIVSGNREGKSQFDRRNEFQNDYDRIVSSSSLRRLQDKAQVFPLEKHDFVRTRLTHSIEVSTLAKSLGLSVGEIIKEKNLDKDFNETTIYKISSVLSCAGLIHDIGNPPFGHFGETAIRGWFKENFNKIKYKGESINTYLDEQHNQQVEDFANFEGNAQALRLLTKLHFVIDENGMNLTYGVLNSIIKYPRNSLEIDENKGISYKKMGYFYSEKDIFNKIIHNTGASNSRHPLTFLLEAADDIAYRAADIEDGYKKGKITYQNILDEFKTLLEQNPIEDEKNLVEKLEKYYSDAIKIEYCNPGFYAIQRFKIIVQGFMLKAVTKAFVENYEDIMNGVFEKELLEVSSANRTCKILKKMTEKYIFKAKDILMLEMTGYKIITNLLELFIKAALSSNYNDSRTKEGKLYNLISDNYRFINENYTQNSNESEYVYNRLLLVTDFICGMTDSYAKELYQNLSGINC